MSISFGGVGTGRGRGYGSGRGVLATQPPVKTDNQMTNANNGYGSKAIVDEDIWDDSTATKTESNKGGWNPGGGNSNDRDWNDNNTSNSWGGGNDRGNQGGGGGGGRACFKCNKEGHMSRECPEAKSSSGCFNCGKDGHQSRDCTEPKKPRGGTCYNCGKEGHQSRECTEEKKGGGGGGACYKCNETGHMSRDCTNPDTRPKTCRKCGGEGHMIRECPQASDEDKKPSKCFKCQEEGHMSRECPNSDASSTACFRCKEEGHMSRDCTKEAPEGEGKPKSTYIPPEITEESDIFNINPQGINFGRYASIPVKATGANCPPPINSFAEAGFRELLNKNIAKAGYKTPTPVQKYAIPILKEKRDLMACAQTGSGKTAAFLLPMINTMFESPDLPGIGCLEPWAVIISPTRELAIQIFNEAIKFSYDSVVKPAILYGGTMVGSQASKLLKGCHLLVATPGRLIHFLNDGKISFKQLHYLVLDEADRLLDMGFKSEIEKMVEHSTMPPKSERQTLMFSATFPREVQELSAQFLSSNYLFLEVGIVGAANQDVKQVLYLVNKFEKRNKLLDILADYGSEKTLVFVEQKKNTDFIASFLSQNDVMTTSIHGDREQREREEALRDFKTGKMKVLVATAVAARGLDITGVRHVINFDLTKDIDEYVHRIGRTGRVGNTGLASSFFDPENDGHLAGDLIKILSDAGQEVPSFLEEAARDGGGGGGGRRFNNRDIRRNQQVTTSSFGEGDDWGGSGGGAPATNASVPVEDDAWD